MAAPDPYAGTPEAFSPNSTGPAPPFGRAGWLEYVRSSFPAGESTFTQTTADSSLVGFIRSEQELAAIRFFLGWNAVGYEAPYFLLRSNPVAHPRYPNLYCVGVSTRPFKPDSSGPGELSQNPWLFPPVTQGLKRFNPPDPDMLPPQNLLCFAGYKLTELTAHFAPLPFPVLDDAFTQTGPGQEAFRNTIWNFEPKQEVLSISNQLVFVEGTGNKPPTSNPGSSGTDGGGALFPAPFAQILVKPDLTVRWVNVPNSYVESSAFYCPNLVNGLGKVNSQIFAPAGGLGYPPGTLLYTGCRLTRNRNALKVPARLAGNIAGIATEPDYLLDIEMVFNYFNPTKGYNNVSGGGPVPGNQIVTNLGHNNCPWAGNLSSGSPAGGDINAGKWFYAVRGKTVNDPPLLDKYNFDNLFYNWNNTPLPP